MRRSVTSIEHVLSNVSLVSLMGILALPWPASASDLASTATNPIGDLIQVQLQYQHGSDIYDLDGNSDVYIAQPVIPFDLPWESVPQLIMRATIPYVSTPDLPGSDSVDGLGDTVLLAFALPKLAT